MKPMFKTLSVPAVVGLMLLGGATNSSRGAEPQLIPVKQEAIAAREKFLAEHGPKGAKLVAYLDCGTQKVSTTTGPVKIHWVAGKSHEFASEAKDIAQAQATVFFDESQVRLKITGLDPSRRYLAGLSWWDYDNSGRTQSVIVGSPDGQLVRLAIPAIRLPNYKDDRQPPAERRFSLPASFARDGELLLKVQLDGGANAVISELWIWQLN